MPVVPWEIYFVIVCLLALPVGRVFLNNGVFGPVLVGLIVVAIPTATVANFDAKLASYLLELSLWSIPLVACVTLLLKYGIPNTSSIITYAISIGLFTGLILITLNVYDQTQYVLSKQNEVLYNSHDGYYAAVPLELLRADYGSRLRVANIYPVEWKTYYFLGGSISANLLKGLTQPNLIDFFNSKLLIALLGYLSIVEAIALSAYHRYKWQSGSPVLRNITEIIRQYVLPIAFVTFMLSWWYGQNFQWNNSTSGGIAMIAGFLFLYFRLNNNLRDSYLWLAIAAVGALRNAPAIAIALPFLVYWDFKTNPEKTLSTKIHNLNPLCKFSFLNTFYVLWPAVLMFVLGFVYCVATLGYSQEALFNLPTINFNYGWWYLVPTFLAFLESISWLISSYPSPFSRYHNNNSVGIFSVLGLFLLFVAPAVQKTLLVVNSKQLRIIKSIALFLIAAFIAILAVMQFGSSSAAKSIFTFLKIAAPLLLIVVIPTCLFYFTLPQRDGKALLALTGAHFFIFTVTNNNVGVTAYCLVYYCYLAALVWLWTSRTSTKKLVTLLSVVGIALLNNGPWFDIGDLYQKQNLIASEYDFRLDLVDAQAVLNAHMDPNGVFCGTGEFLKDDAIASYFGVRRGWDSQIARDNVKAVISMRHSQVASSQEQLAAFSRAESNFCN